MKVSVFDIFKIGIGPSSSHTIGPMKAAYKFVLNLKQRNLLHPEIVKNVSTDLYGSLALTGKGHCTDIAVLLGLMGFTPETIDTQKVPQYMKEIDEHGQLKLGGEFFIQFSKSRDIVFRKKEKLDFHTNGMEFSAFSKDLKSPIIRERYYSVGGGFILNDEEALSSTDNKNNNDNLFPYHFSTCKELMDLCEFKKLTISELMRKNELSLRSEHELNTGLDKLWEVMQQCIQNGFVNEGILPGGLKLVRRAPAFHKSLLAKNSNDPNKWLSLYALAVNEENANGGKVVTAPTNGAAGIVPAVLMYYDKFLSKEFPNKHRDFLLTAAAIAILFKKGATISGAEGGCQAEVGVACSMAAAGLTEAIGGSIYHIENAAEIGIEHNLGLTCDPVAGLVQIPCIERNTMGAVKAVNASNLALAGDGRHFVSLDTAIKTMKKIGDDMKEIYKETSLGGLAETVQEQIETLADSASKKTSKLSKINKYMPEC